MDLMIFFMFLVIQIFFQKKKTKKVINKKIQHCFVQSNLEILFEVIPVVSKKNFNCQKSKEGSFLCFCSLKMEKRTPKKQDFQSSWTSFTNLFFKSTPGTMLHGASHLYPVDTTRGVNSSHSDIFLFEPDPVLLILGKGPLNKCKVSFGYVGGGQIERERGAQSKEEVKKYHSFGSGGWMSIGFVLWGG